MRSDWPATQRPRTRPSADITRPRTCGEARQASRSATRPKPTGSTRTPIHMGTSVAIMSPPARYVSTSFQPPAAKMIATMALTKPERTWAASPSRPLGMNSPVASVRSLPSRAAIAPPSRPTHIVSQLAIGPAPRMPWPVVLRQAISASGSAMTAPSASVARTFSKRTTAAFIYRRGPCQRGPCGRRHAPAPRGRRRRPAPSSRASSRPVWWPRRGSPRSRPHRARSPVDHASSSP